MKTVVSILLAVLMMLTGCGPSRADLETWVKGELQKHVQTDPVLKPYGITVESVQLVESGKNKYEGMGMVKFQGAEKAVPLEVTADGERMMYQTKPSAFDFVAQAEMQKAQEELAAEMQKADEQAAALQAEAEQAQGEMEAASEEMERALGEMESALDSVDAVGQL